MFCFSLTLPLSNREHIIGTKVKDKINAPNKAKPTVKAIGLNIFPSMPPNANIGR